MKKYISILFFAALLLSCGKFLEEYSQNLSYVRTIDDLAEILAGEAYMPDRTEDRGLYQWIDVMDDNMSMETLGSDPKTNFVYMQGFYNWDQYPYFETSSVSVDANHGGNTTWKNLYHFISATNVVLEQVEKFQSESKYREVKGDALFLRGCYYFYLVNLWAKPYVKAKAAEDPGVPVKVTSEIETHGFARNTIAEVYDRIVADLTASQELLEGITRQTKYYPSENAVKVFLSRVYLYMGEWEKAFDYADQVVARPKGTYLFDMNAAMTPVKYKEAAWTKTGYSFPEYIFINGSSSTLMTKNTGGVFCVSDELYTIYPQQDKRKEYWFSKVIYKGMSRIVAEEKASTSYFSNFSISIAEAYLNKAEAEAMLDRPADARETISALRRCRLTGGVEIEPDFTTLEGEDLVKFIRTERRRETIFRGHRWFDLRRYAVCPKYPQKTTIRHNMTAWDAAASQSVYDGYYELGEYPDDGGWVMPFPKYALISNEGKLEDNERPVRKKQ